MEHKFRRLLSRMTYFTEEFTPFCEKACAPVFLFIKDRMEELIKERKTQRIEMQEFESHLKNNPDLTDTYLELFSATADFYKCVVDYEGRVVEFFIMYERRVVLVYFFKK